MRLETQGPFLVDTVILRFLSIFSKSQASSPFEALNSACLSRCQRDVRPPVQMRRGSRAFAMVCTVYSDIPSSCEKKDEHSFKPLQRYATFYRVRALRYPFQLNQQTLGPSHIPTAEGRLLFRCLWKVCLPLHSNTGNHLSSRDDMECTEHSLSFLLTLVFL